MAASSQKTSGIENRRSPRRVFTRPIGVLCDGHYRLVHAVEISESGIRFSSGSTTGSVGDARFAKEDQLVLTILMPNNDAIVVRGAVIRETIMGSTYQYGCQFESLGLQQRRAIRSYVSAKTQAEAENESGDSDVG